MKHIASISFTTSAGPVGNTHKEHAALLAHRFLDPYFCRSRENYDTMSRKTCEIVKFNHKYYLDRIIYIYIYSTYICDIFRHIISNAYTRLALLFTIR